jgi:tRNA (guanine6-N2)-methyltransferase
LELGTSIFALTTRGLEPTSAAETAALPGVTVTQTAYRRVAAACEGSLAPLLGLRTVDDVYLNLAAWDDITHTRDRLAVIEWGATQLELEAAREQITALRPIPAAPAFSVTASFVGKRNYTTDEIKTAVSNGVMSSHPWTYTIDDRDADLNIRVFIEHHEAFIGLRLGKHPLHERPYKTVERPGSLKPSVAAAMLSLAGVQPGHRLLDPCCGAGTILIEGALSGAIARGGDIDPDAVAAARLNAQAAGVSVDLQAWDARAIPLPDRSVDRIVTNLPWGRQIVVDDELAKVYREICREIERLLVPGGRAAILTSAPHLLHFEGLRGADSFEISLFGQTPTITILDG